MSESCIKKSVVVAVDPGDKASGIVVLVDGHIKLASNSSNEKIMDEIRPYLGPAYKLRVVVEDIRPYSRRELSPNVIGTCKYIGELEYRLKTARIAYRLYPRANVKQWIFDNFKKLVIPMVDAKIVERIKQGKYTNVRKASFVYVDDKMVVAAMRHYLELPKPTKVAEGNKYGLSEHSWQALALGLMYISKHQTALAT